jgi:hypothetical protein
MKLLIWASGHWHLFLESGVVAHKGDDYESDQVSKHWPDAEVYLAVPEHQLRIESLGKKEGE